MGQSNKGKYEYLERRAKGVVQCKFCKNKSPLKEFCEICKGQGYVTKP